MAIRHETARRLQLAMPFQTKLRFLRRLPPVFTAFLALAAGCGKAPSPPPTAEVEQLRAELAQPARFPVRNGLAIDLAPIQRAVGKLTVVDRAELATRFAADLRELPRTSPPAAPEYGPVADLRAVDLESIGETMAQEYLLDPNPERLALRGVFMVLPLQMARSLGLPTRTVAAWLGFLRMARPLASHCGHDGTQVAICLDYGGLDVFVVTLAARGATWVPQEISWQQRGRADPSRTE
jgi:hypothetical protein